MKEAFSLRTVHKKIVMLSKLAGIILIFSYILSAGLPVSEDLAFLIWLFFILLLIFNSRPHAEVDPDSYWTIDRNTSFNSRPHAEVDPKSSAADETSDPFNSRPHAEVDPDREGER